MRAAALLLLLIWPLTARADIVLGALLSLTGPGAGLGIPERNTIALLPPTIAGQPVRWVVLDDRTDSAAAVQAAAKLIDAEHVDAIIGPSTTPNSVAILDAAGASGTPFISLSGSSDMIVPPEGTRRWAFKMLPSERTATAQLAAHMAAHGVKTLAQIGFATALGDGYIRAMTAEAEAQGVHPAAEERYNAADPAVTPQILHILAAHPDAVFVAASATPATTPILELRRRGFTGAIYTVMGIAGPDAIRVGGAALDGVMFSSVPVLVAEQMPDNAPAKAPGLAYVHAYEAANGPGSRSLFGATFWDAFALVDSAAPAALAQAQPGTPAFRTALRDAMERVTNLAGAQGVFNLTPTDHSGAAPDSQVLVEIRNGTYRIVP